MPFFSIIIPVFNRLQFLEETINNVLDQTIHDFELIIVDDGSTDDVEETLNILYRNETRIRVIKQENRERGAARNNGFRNALGKYVVFLDSDDLLQPKHLEILLYNIQKQNEPLFIATKFNFLRNGKCYPSDIEKYKEGYYDYKMFLNGNPLACNICVKKGNPKIHPFEEDRAFSVIEDWLFMLQNLRNQKLFLIDNVTLSMVDHQERSMRTDNSQLIKKIFFALTWILEKIELSEREKKQLITHVNYFSAIHSYIDGKKKDSIRYLLAAISLGGIKAKFILLLIKSTIGYSFISKLKRGG